jgi:hypothetical protein
MSSFFTWHIFLKLAVGETQNLPSKFWQTRGDALPRFSKRITKTDHCYNNKENVLKKM